MTANHDTREQLDTSWRDILSRLQTNGCSILVHGQVGDEDSATFMRKRGFGVGEKPRVLALTDVLNTVPDDYCRDVWTSTQTRTIRRQIQTARSTSSQMTPTPDTIISFQTTILQAVCDLCDHDATPDLRVAVDSLGALIEQESLPAAKTLVKTLNATVADSYHGIIFHHYRLRDGDVLHDLADLVDARIELAYPRATELQYRWHVDGKTSKWMTVSRVEPRET